MRKIMRVVGFLLALILAVVPTFAFKTDRASVEAGSDIEYQLIMSAFEGQYKNSMDGKKYPDYYAGAYIDSFGELVVILTDTDDYVVEQVVSITKNPSMKISQASVSLNELEARYNEILDAMAIVIGQVNEGNLVATDMVDLVESCAGVGIKQKDNVIFVELRENSSDVRNAFRKYVSSYDNIRFETLDKIVSTEVNIKVIKI